MIRTPGRSAAGSRSYHEQPQFDVTAYGTCFLQSWGHDVRRCERVNVFDFEPGAVVESSEDAVRTWIGSYLK